MSDGMLDPVVDLNIRVDAEPGADVEMQMEADPSADVSMRTDVGSGASEKNAEAWAVGERGGVPVGPGDPNWHNNSKYYAEQAAGSLDQVNQDAAEAADAAAAAAGSASAAAGSAETAGQKARDAEESATEAGNKATAAAGSAETAAQKAQDAADSATAAGNKATAAAGSAETATRKAQDAADSAAAASGSADDAAGSATAAEQSATTAGNKAQAAEDSADAAAASAVTAGQKAQDAADSATAASGSAGTASQKAQDAADSATAASGSAGTAAQKAQDAADSATAASGSAGTAAQKAQDAADSATAASGSAGTAAQKAQDAADSATAASGSAGTAAQKAQDAADSALAASGSATAAAGSASAAAESAFLAGAPQRVTSLNNIPLAGVNVVEAVGIPVYVDNVLDYPGYGITDTGWYTFARIAARSGVTVTAQTTVTGADGYKATIGDGYVDVAVRFDVAAVSKAVVIDWGSYTDTFVFRATDLAVRNLDYRSTFYIYDIAPYAEYTYALTSDATFQAGQKYYTLSGGVYTEAEVTTGATVPANTYYVHTKLTFSGMTRNITYRFDAEIDCPLEIVLPEIPDDGYGAWFEIQMKQKAAYSLTLNVPAGVSVATNSVVNIVEGVNVLDLIYADVGDAKVWRGINTQNHLPTPAA